MSPLNQVMNRVDSWGQKVDEIGIPQSWAKRHLLTRAITFAAGVPVELTAALQNIIATPVYAAGVVGKLATKTLRVCSSSEFLKNLDEVLPGPAQLVRTVLRVVAYAIGAIFTGTLGVLSPSANFRLHCSVPFVDLTTNVREAKLKSEWQQKIEAEKQKRAEEEAQAEEILAAVAAMLEKAEMEAEKEENERRAAAELAKTAEQQKTGQEVVARVDDVSSSEEIAKASQPTFFQRLFGWTSTPETPVEPEAPVAVEVPVNA